MLAKYDERAVVAIMGGHSLSRTDDVYYTVAKTSKLLTEQGKLMVSATMTKQEGESTLVDNEQVKALIGDKTIVKIIFVPGRLVNFIAK